MLSASIELKTSVDQVLSGFGLVGAWQLQHKQFNSVCMEIKSTLSEIDSETLASRLRAMPIWFELEASSQYQITRFLNVPVLGLHRQVLDLAGEVQIRQSAIDQAVYLAKGNGKELERLLRQITGQNHLDLLDQLRIEDLRTIPRAV